MQCLHLRFAPKLFYHYLVGIPYGVSIRYFDKKSPTNIPYKPVAVPLNCKVSMVQGEDIDNIDLYCKDVVSETCSV